MLGFLVDGHIQKLYKIIDDLCLSVPISFLVEIENIKLCLLMKACSIYNTNILMGEKLHIPSEGKNMEPHIYRSQILNYKKSS